MKRNINITKKIMLVIEIIVIIGNIILGINRLFQFLYINEKWDGLRE